MFRRPLWNVAFTASGSRVLSHLLIKNNGTSCFPSSVYHQHVNAALVCLTRLFIFISLYLLQQKVECFCWKHLCRFLFIQVIVMQRSNLDSIENGQNDSGRKSVHQTFGKTGLTFCQKHVFEQEIMKLLMQWCTTTPTTTTLYITQTQILPPTLKPGLTPQTGFRACEDQSKCPHYARRIVITSYYFVTQYMVSIHTCTHIHTHTPLYHSYDYSARELFY